MTIKVIVTSPRTTVYQQAHRTAEVLLTPRVEQLIEQGTLIQVSEGTTYVDTDGDPITRLDPPTRDELVAEALKYNVTPDPVWTKARLQEEIDHAKRNWRPTSPIEDSPVTPVRPTIANKE